MAPINKKQLGYHSLPKRIVLDEVYEENSVSHRYTVGKVRSILIMFSGNWEFFKIVLQYTQTWQVVVSCSVEYGTFVFITLKSVGLSL